MRGELVDAGMQRGFDKEAQAEQAWQRRIKQEQEAAAGLPVPERFKQFP